MALPLRILIGSVHKAPASFAIAWYLWLQPLQSSSLAELGATAPVATEVPVLAVAAEVDAPAEPVRLSWQMTAAAMAGTRSSRHLRPRAGGDSGLDGAEVLLGDQGERMAIPFPLMRGRPPRCASGRGGHAGVTVSRYETLAPESNNRANSRQ